MHQFHTILLVGRTFVLPIFNQKVRSWEGDMGEEVQFLFGDWGKIVVTV